LLKITFGYYRGGNPFGTSLAMTNTTASPSPRVKWLLRNKTHHVTMYNTVSHACMSAH